jgi:hypothetical protein
MSEKREFLVVYDYGMGGLWGIVNARSQAEIADLYPELVVVDDPPAWMSSDRLQRLRDQEWHDIDGAPWGILNAVLADRTRGDGG